jgi:hypothetical protein
MFESEMRVVAGLSNAWENTEVASSIYGLQADDGSFVIFLVTAPGQDAMCNSVSCQHDLPFFYRTTRIIEDAFGLKWIGDQHSHHWMGLNLPSAGDLDQVRSVTSKNGRGRWCGIITTKVRDTARQAFRGLRQNSTSRAPSPQVKVNAFIYTSPRKGQFVRARIRVLAGMSPVRLSLLASRRLDPSDIGEPVSAFPMDRIIYDRAPFEGTPSGQRSNNLKTLGEQLSELPEDVQKKLDLHAADGVITITMPLRGDGRGYVALGERPPHRILAVHLEHDADDKTDVTSVVIADASDLRLKQAYARLNGVLGQRSSQLITPSHASRVTAPVISRPDSIQSIGSGGRPMMAHCPIHMDCMTCCLRYLPSGAVPTTLQNAPGNECETSSPRGLQKLCRDAVRSIIGRRKRPGQLVIPGATCHGHPHRLWTPFETPCFDFAADHGIPPRVASGGYQDNG